MNTLFPIGNKHIIAYKENWGRFLAFGILLIILGIVSISLSEFTTLLSILVIGFFIFASGMIVIMDTFTFWLHKWHGFWLHLLMGLLYSAIGIVLIALPGLSSMTLTLLLAILFVFLGIFRIIFSLSHQLPRWGWSLFNGILTLILGVLIMSSWPASSLFVIGLFVGIDLLFAGIAYVMAALSADSHKIE